ncbi:MAG: hypothetical protein GWP91_17165 [Rhodobacterales bacterium]|nr:hypothetical protein [Rhodobacterales bacterium]
MSVLSRIQNASTSLTQAKQNTDRQISVLKKANQINKDMVSSLLSNQFNGVGQVINTTA